MRERCSTGRGSREYYGLWVPLSKMELSAVGERVFAAESIIKRRIRKVRPRPGRPVFSAVVSEPAGPRGAAVPLAGFPQPPPRRLLLASLHPPHPHPLFFSFCFSGAHRVPGEMERVGDQVSVGRWHGDREAARRHLGLG